MQATSMPAWLTLAFSLAFVACEGTDPMSQSEGDLEVTFDVQADRVETFSDVEVQVQVSQAGSPVQVQNGELAVQGPSGGAFRYMTMEPQGDGYRLRLMFQESGLHRVEFHAQGPGRGEFQRYGQSEIRVHRRHHIIGSYWVELEVEPRPVVIGQATTISLLAFELLADNTPGEPAGGLEVAMTLEDPDGVQAQLAVSEVATGEYEATNTFESPGVYDLYVQIGSGDAAAGSEFHIPVFESAEDAECHHYRGPHRSDGSCNCNCR
ncbi:MAG: hypothetical protein JSU87_12175 [Gemmatimonadota bacterium]|nr:MAG: hypothetical protein JSU87_12175 [Gemmatimonadota bacterium]